MLCVTCLQIERAGARAESKVLKLMASDRHADRQTCRQTDRVTKWVIVLKQDESYLLNACRAHMSSGLQMLRLGIK